MAEEKKKTSRSKKSTTTRKRTSKAAEAKKAHPPVVAEAPKVETPKVEAPKPTPEHKPVHRAKKEKSKKATFYGTGRRKRAVAKVYISSGEGKINVNDKPFDAYFFGREVLLKTVNNPFALTNTSGAYDVNAYVLGGGIPSQADAVRMGIARALVAANLELKGVLRSTDMLRRDPREKERKKFGLKRARRAFQYTKR